MRSASDSQHLASTHAAGMGVSSNVQACRRFFFHGLRHTATLLLARGVNVKVVSEMLGHSSVAVTLTLYGHVLPHMQRDAAITMDQVLRGIILL